MKWRIEISGAGYGIEEVLHDIQMEFDQGELLLVVGGNAAGKSTLLKSLMGLVPDVDGRISWSSCSVDLDSIRPGRNEFAYLPQEGVVFPRLTVRENIEVACYGIRSGERAVNLESMISMMPVLESLLHRFGGDLSAGQRQFVGLAMSLVRRPKLALLDEPCAGLDAVAAGEIVSAIDQLRRDQGLTVVVAEHRSLVFSESARMVVGLRRGRVVFEGSTDQLEQTEVLEALFGLGDPDCAG